MTKLARLICTTLVLVCTALPRASHASAPVVVLRSDTTAAFFIAHRGDYERLLSPWREFFARQRIKARELTADQLASVKEPGVLVLASTVALAEPERAAIRERLAAGWSVLGTWAIGVRDGQGAWSGYGFVEELFGAQVVPELAPGKEERFLLPFGETPLTHALSAGKRIYLMPTSEPLLRVRAKNPAARFGTYMREVTQPGALLGAAAFEERDGARRAFFGFAETTWEGAQEDIDALLAGAFDWLRRKPILVKSAWPHPYQAAVLLEMDTEDKFANSVRFATQLEKFGIRGTFYSLTSEAARHPALVKRLASKHEIAYHADVHEGFAKLPRERQDARLKAMIKQMAKLLPDVSVASGFRAPFEQYDMVTEKLLRANGLKHHAASPAAAEDVLPAFSSAEPGVPPERALVVLPRTWLDDINLIAAGRMQRDAAEKVMLGSLEDTVALRGLGLLSLHTQHFYVGSTTERALPRLLESMVKQEQLWPAPGEAIARWWRDRAAVDVAIEADDGGLRIRLVAKRPVSGLRLVLFPGYASSEPRLERRTTAAALQRLDAYRWGIVLKELPAGVSELRVNF
jgi:peptidoglycan/xylan/chitin deacetylase (PgdA/CDA1 family)